MISKKIVLFSLLLVSTCLPIKPMNSVLISSDERKEIIQAVNENLIQVHNNPTVRQLNAKLENLLSNFSHSFQHLEQFLTIMSLRVKLMQGMFLESCARKAVGLEEVSENEFSRICVWRTSLINKNLELYRQAEIAYSEASCDVQRAINVLEVLATHTQIAAYKHCDLNSDIFTYERLRPFFASHALKQEFPDAYKNYLFSEKSIDEITQLQDLFLKFFYADYYKGHLKFIYDQVYRAYLRSVTDNSLPSISQSIFSLDDVRNFSGKSEFRSKFCHFSRLVRLCKIKDLLLAKKQQEHKNQRNNLQKRLIANRIKDLNFDLGFNGQKRPFSFQLCLDIIPIIFGYLPPCVQQEIEFLIESDQKALGFTALEAYFDDTILMMQGESMPYEESLTSDLECNFLSFSADQDACKKFSCQAQQLVDQLFFIPLSQQIQEESQEEVVIQKKKKSNKKNKKKNKKKKTKTQKRSVPSSQLELNLVEGPEDPHKPDCLEKAVPDQLRAFEQGIPQFTLEEIDTSLKSQQPHIDCVFPAVQTRGSSLDEEVIQESIAIPVQQDHCLYQDKSITCFLDCQRAQRGGYQIQIFIYKKDDISAKNLLLNLDYSKLEKIHDVRDNNHSFTCLVEKQCGQYALIENIEELSEQDFEYKNGYRYKYFIMLPGRLSTLGYPLLRAKDQGPNGAFEFTVLKKHEDDEGGICVHRFFRPNK